MGKDRIKGVNSTIVNWGKNSVTFENLEDAVEKTGYYVLHDDERFTIVLNGYKKVKRHHSFMQKCQIMLEIVDP